MLKFNYIILLVTLSLIGCGKVDKVAGNTAVTEAKTVALTQPEHFRTLSWAQLASALKKISDNVVLRTSFMEVFSPETDTPPSIYLAAVIKLGEKNYIQANALFNRVAPDSIPAQFVYAPFRLQEEIGFATNRYLHAMLKAVDSGAVSKLIAARVLSATGRLSTSLELYLETDPADWKRYDYQQLTALYNHDGMRPDVNLLIAGAQRSGRLPPDVSAAFDKFLKDPKLAPPRSALSSNAAAAAIEEILFMRRSFLKRNFEEMTRRYSGRDPRSVSDEINLMLVVAYAALDDKQEADRWALELKRRFPDQETKSWLSQLI